MGTLSSLLPWSPPQAAQAGAASRLDVRSTCPRDRSKGHAQRGLKWVEIRVTNCASFLGLGDAQDMGLSVLKLRKSQAYWDELLTLVKTLVRQARLKKNKAQSIGSGRSTA